MVKVEVIEEFTLREFNKLKNIQRKAKEEIGRLFVGDIFECDIDMLEYLTKTNALRKAFVKIIEIMPEKEELKNAKKVVIELKEDKKNTTTKKATKTKKTIAKK